MQNNIFIKMKKDKFNPDIELKLKGKEDERTNINYDLSNTIYNPITGIIPKKIESNKDLVLNKISEINKVDIKKLITDKNNERLNQDNIYKPIKTKVINNTITPQTTEIKTNNNESKTNNINRTNYIETYEDMKNLSHINKLQSQLNKNNYDNIFDGLKDLGIIK
jgi:hypothetical protein